MLSSLLPPPGGTAGLLGKINRWLFDFPTWLIVFFVQDVHNNVYLFLSDLTNIYLLNNILLLCIIIIIIKCRIRPNVITEDNDPL